MGLPLGGGKAVIIINARRETRPPELWEAFGRAVDSLGGKYITAEDVGTNAEHLVVVHRMTEHVVGLPDTSGDPSPVTAFGVFSGMKACLEYVFGNDSFAGRTVAVQGLGAVGMHLCRHLHEAGARLVVTDMGQERVSQRRLGVRRGSGAARRHLRRRVRRFRAVRAGRRLNDETIPQLKARIVAGSANNQLAEHRHGDMLRERDVLYAPDFIINGGGVINVYHELAPGGYDREKALARVAKSATRWRKPFSWPRNGASPRPTPRWSWPSGAWRPRTPDAGRRTPKNSTRRQRNQFSLPFFVRAQIVMPA